MANHTPTPWKVAKSPHYSNWGDESVIAIRSEDAGQFVANLEANANDEADAELIVRAVNSYELFKKVALMFILGYDQIPASMREVADDVIDVVKGDS